MPAVHATVTLGQSGITMRPVGLGCMGMSQSYGSADRGESIATIRAALDLGVGMLDTSDIYGAAVTGDGPVPGFGHNEELIAEAIAGRRQEAVLATKFGGTYSPNKTMGIDGSAGYAAQACDASLRRLRTDYIDLYYLHRQDRRVPIEETVGAMGELVKAGKVRALGVCELNADTLRRAHEAFPIAALQSEYSLWERGIEAEVLPVCRELGITVVPYSPLGRAMLTGQVASTTTFGSDDFRTTVPKFQGDNLAANLRLVEALRAFSTARGVTPGQVALAWLLAQPTAIAPIPGTKRRKYLKENVAATSVPLSRDDVAGLSAIFAPENVSGARYPRPVRPR
jgi:aryl-alcohol dehydrogenase-like predicted oxidoreductase